MLLRQRPFSSPHHKFNPDTSHTSLLTRQLPSRIGHNALSRKRSLRWFSTSPSIHAPLTLALPFSGSRWDNPRAVVVRSNTAGWSFHVTPSPRSPKVQIGAICLWARGPQPSRFFGRSGMRVQNQSSTLPLGASTGPCYYLRSTSQQCWDRPYSDTFSLRLLGSPCANSLYTSVNKYCLTSAAD